MAQGLSHRYDLVENIDPALCELHLYECVEDKYSSATATLEYILIIEELHRSNYIEKKMHNLLDVEIHRI